MSLQSGKNVLVVYKAQSGLGVPATGTGGTGVRMVPSSGMALSKAIIASNEVRRDGMSTLGRHGTKKTGGSYQMELSPTTLDDMIAAALRTAPTAQVAITQASMTSITTTANTIVAASGSWLTQGVRAGDMVMLTGHSTAANNSKWIRVVAASALTLTTPAGALTLDNTPDTTFTLTVAKTFIPGASPVEQYFTFEEYSQDIDTCETYTDVKVTKIEFSMQPDQPIVATVTLMGLNATSGSGASAPTLTAPTYTTTLPLVMSDGTIRINGVDYKVLTGFTLTLDLGGQTPSTLAPVAPDVFLSNAKLSGSFSLMRADTVMFDAFNAETILDFFVHCKANTVEPAAFVSFYIGNATLSGNNAPIGSDGPVIETVPWNAGVDTTGSGRALTMMKVSTG